MKVIINTDAHKNHRPPHWPWYLGTFKDYGDLLNPIYIPNLEGKVFEVTEDEENKRFVVSSFNGRNNYYYINKKDCTIIE